MESRTIRLSWPQIAWAMSLLVTVVAAWFDLRYQVRSLAVDLRVTNEEVRELNRRVSEIEHHRREWRGR